MLVIANKKISSKNETFYIYEASFTIGVLVLGLNGIVNESPSIDYIAEILEKVIILLVLFPILLFIKRFDAPKT